MLTEINGNIFKGDDIETLKPEGDGLAEYWILTLKNGQILHIKPDWRGDECYLGLYNEAK